MNKYFLVSIMLFFLYSCTSNREYKVEEIKFEDKRGSLHLLFTIDDNTIYSYIEMSVKIGRSH